MLCMLVLFTNIKLHIQAFNTKISDLASDLNQRNDRQCELYPRSLSLCNW